MVNKKDNGNTIKKQSYNKITAKQIDKVLQFLDKQPTTEIKFSKYDAIGRMSEKIKSMLTAGVSIREIAKRITAGGLPINEQVLGIYLKKLNLYAPRPRRKLTDEERTAKDEAKKAKAVKKEVKTANKATSAPKAASGTQNDLAEKIAAYDDKLTFDD